MTGAHTASCRCGQLKATATGVPVRVSVCHCLDCQKRCGSAFAAQVRFPADSVTIVGEAVQWTSENGGVFRHCPVCGATVAFAAAIPDTIAIPLGAFDDPYAFIPTVSVWEERQHEWVEIAGDIEHFD
ncbi:GFA family protein [Sphingomonas sp. HDW15A]|uniref:GFA family protein n=1 Tax=Sphingomonas sp. HDW15A TaxID=2714942 RepID=UPI0014075927|nr:GFA family protein [Sphingomonas sp. HDW15A]QIK95223.1 GFA family protein [Sphingomonas sp. HDW15A]